MRNILALVLPLLSLVACADLPADPAFSPDAGRPHVSANSGEGTGAIDAARLGRGAAGGAVKSDPARVCRQDGWTTLTRADGSRFRNTGDCVSYRVRGGEFGSPSSGNCRSIDGFADFLIVGTANTPGSGRFYPWDGSCTGTSTVGTYIVSDIKDDAISTCFDSTFFLNPIGWSPAFVLLAGIGSGEWACGDARFLP